jgi:hypothetical protein
VPWEPVGSLSTELTAIHAALLPTSPRGDILCFGDWAGSGAGGVVPSTLSRIFHVDGGGIDSFDDSDLPDTNGFCGGQAWLADGRMLLAGGTVGWPEAHVGLHDPHYDGERACWLYLPNEARWTRVRDLRFQPGDEDIGGGRWYPTLVTLSNGEVIAIAGHPDVSDNYLSRHNNNTPERYSPSANHWTLMENGHTAPNSRNTDSYPRYHLLPNGLLFCDTSGDEDARQHLDPFTGLWTGDDVDVGALPGYYAEGSSGTSVLLPLLPPNYRPRIVAFNSPLATAFRIDPAENDPAWTTTPNRIGTAAGQDRQNGCATLLPTGSVLLTGGWPRDTDNDIDTATRVPELYNPGIDWSAGDFSGSEGWTDLSGEQAVVGRGYHSTALLLPDGRVWTAGSTGSLVGAEDRVEIYAPSYVGQSRPTLSNVPAAINYGLQFTVTVDRDIERVALMRCGTITHGFDSDQRYVGCAFTQEGDTLTITAPPNGNIAPPGPYMLWVIDSSDRPCELAAFVRLSTQQLLLYTDRSTFSVHEIAVLGVPATFNYAFYLLLDGALPGEVGSPIPNPRDRLRLSERRSGAWHDLGARNQEVGGSFRPARYSPAADFRRPYPLRQRQRLRRDHRRFRRHPDACALRRVHGVSGAQADREPQSLDARRRDALAQHRCARLPDPARRQHRGRRARFGRQRAVRLHRGSLRSAGGRRARGREPPLPQRIRHGSGRKRPHLRRRRRQWRARL